ncbi:hypothetical protein [Acinetobacter soli]|uniref:hypothetical protein n=1 Tax=Acinetobacter soli TaxID=487316 RepID=UPI00125D3662|nr:hypothetical protein [Acinetobacter soli]
MDLNKLIEIGKKDLDISSRADQVKDSYDKAVNSYSMALTGARNRLIDIFFDEVEAMFINNEKFEIENNRDVADGKNFIVLIRGTEIKIILTVLKSHKEKLYIPIQIHVIRGKSEEVKNIELRFTDTDAYIFENSFANLDVDHLTAKQLDEMQKENQVILQKTNKVKVLNVVQYRLTNDRGSYVGGVINESDNFNYIFERSLDLMKIFN